MNKRNTTWGRVGAAVAAASLLAVTGCDPFIGANTAAPVVLGAAVVDVTGATSFGWTVPPFGYNFPAIPDLDNGCFTPYPEPDLDWATSLYPGLCVPQNAVDFLPTVCPVSCFPPRSGPAYAPLFTGDLGGSYLTRVLGVQVIVPYSLPADGRYTVRRVPTDYEPLNGQLFSQIYIQFNKLMDPKTIQPVTTSCVPPPLLPGSTLPRVQAISPANSEGAMVDVTDQFTICYNPSSSAEFWGASMLVTPTALNVDDFPVLAPDTRYRIFGTVADQAGATVVVDVTVITDAAPAPVRAK
jgi:hypothetical protein